MGGAYPRLPQLVSAAAFTIVVSACGGSHGSSPPLLPQTRDQATVRVSQAVDRDSLAGDNDNEDNGVSFLKNLDDITTIGSTVDPTNGDQNPYGLDVAKRTAGLIRAGDLVICNFNDRVNVQGTGTSIVVLHPHAGATPTHIRANEELLGCTALAVGATDAIWAAAFGENDDPIVSPGGALITPLDNPAWHHPFGEIFASGSDDHPPAFYVSNAGDGSIVRVAIEQSGFVFETIAHGFAVNGGAPGSILGPSGLQYDAKHDRLYIIDGADNTVTAFRHVSTVPANGIVVHGRTFTGPFAHRARSIYAGAPLNGPISSALLPHGHLVLGNTLDPNGKNLMVEISSRGELLDVKNVDTGVAGALFGMVATGDELSEIHLYFNDDNDNALKVLTK